MGQGLRVRRVELATGVSVPCVSAGPAAAAPVVLLHAWGESRRSFDRLLPQRPLLITAQYQCDQLLAASIGQQPN